jgi:hypothetical protein
MTNSNASASDANNALWWEERSAAVSKAVGMASAQADCSLMVALLLLRHRAIAMGCNIEDAAAGVVSRRVAFSSDSPSDLLNRLTTR